MGQDNHKTSYCATIIAKTYLYFTQTPDHKRRYADAHSQVLCILFQKRTAVLFYHYSFGNSFSIQLQPYQVQTFRQR